MPWTAQISRLPALAVQRSLSLLWLLELHSTGLDVGAGVRIFGRPIVTREAGSVIALGDRVSLISRSRDTALGVGHPVVLRTLREGARLTVGADSGLSGVTICAANAVEVGERVLLGADVLVADTDFHPVDVAPRRYAPLPPANTEHAVIIENDVFVGARAIVLAGSHIGAGSVIGAGSIVSGRIPAGVVAAGNPCRVLRQLPGARP